MPSRKRNTAETIDDLTAEYVRSIMIYNPETGDLYFKPRPVRAEFLRTDLSWNGRYARHKRAQLKPGEARRVKIDGKLYLAHRVAWLVYHGQWPARLLDHKNRDRGDNRIRNLRLATPSTNSANAHRSRYNTTGYKGVDYRASHGKFRARICFQNRSISLGYFDTAEQAHAAYATAAVKLFGDFARFE